MAGNPVSLPSLPQLASLEEFSSGTGRMTRWAQTPALQGENVLFLVTNFLVTPERVQGRCSEVWLPGSLRAGPWFLHQPWVTAVSPLLLPRCLRLSMCCCSPGSELRPFLNHFISSPKLPAWQELLQAPLKRRRLRLSQAESLTQGLQCVGVGSLHLRAVCFQILPLLFSVCFQAPPHPGPSSGHSPGCWCNSQNWAESLGGL